jgi:2-hydroxycyclohexanecarboxyl-CoA dehydrogenase
VHGPAHDSPSRVALVSGGAGGIGQEIVRALAADDRAVAIGDLSLDAAEALAGELRAQGAAASAVALDVTDPDSVSAAIERVGAELGSVSVLVNNAGWDLLMPFLDTDEDFWQRVLEVNFLGALRLTHATLPAMIEQGWGRIVNVASDAARVGSSGETVYAGAKGALVAFTKSIAREVARRGVTANAVCPGPTDTPLLGALAQATPDAAKLIASLERAVPMRRLGRGEDIATAVRFLASEQTGYITGQTLSVSGGLTMA